MGCLHGKRSLPQEQFMVIYVVDDDDSVRDALLRQLTTAGYNARGYSSAGEFLLNPPSGPGCVLLDIQLPGPSGIDLQAAMRDRGIDLPVIFLTGHANVSLSVLAMKAGAVDFLEKPAGREKLLEAIARALAQDLNARNERGYSDALHARFGQLTLREQAVFSRVVEGKANKLIAYEIGVAERTVKVYRAQMMKKLGVRSSAELGALGIQLLKSGHLISDATIAASTDTWSNCLI
jgi:FixJ family two-component response regulator